MLRIALALTFVLVSGPFLLTSCGGEQPGPAPAAAPAKDSGGLAPVSLGKGGTAPVAPVAPVAPAKAPAEPPKEADLLGKAERTLSSPDEEERAGVIEVLLSAKDRKAAGRIAEKMLGDENDDIRALAAETIGKLEYTEGTTALRTLLARESSALVRKAALQSLYTLLGKTAVPDLLRAVDKDEDSAVRAMAARMIGDLAAPEAGDPLVAKMADEYDPDVRVALAEALRKIKPAKASGVLIEALEDQHVGVRTEAARALGEMKERKAVGPLVRVLSPDEDSQTLVAMLEALAKITGNEVEYKENDEASQKQAIEEWNVWWEEHQGEY
ncbi:MAG: HEAT repeat domain-containing protein [Planctomycetes bacterium]|jgi:HEAT repeat protein|nr:HEAT repeat domain-containing protein [Planctomycetota bacterium]